MPTYHNSLNASLPLHRRKGLGSGKSEAWLLFTETVLPPWTSASVGNLPVLSVPAAGLAVLYSNKRNIPKLKWKCHWLSVEINPLNTFFFFWKRRISACNRVYYLNFCLVKIWISSAAEVVQGSLKGFWQQDQCHHCSVSYGDNFLITCHMVGTFAVRKRNKHASLKFYLAVIG